MAVTENEIAREIVDAAYKIHTRLGPGLLESVYQAVLCYELEKRGFAIERQKPIPIVYEDVHLDEGFRADIIVADKVIIELKSIAEIADVHKKQLLTYLRLADKRLGLLINFNEVLIKNGITRIVNNLPDTK
jgi:GxxExxY protein